MEKSRKRQMVTSLEMAFRNYRGDNIRSGCGNRQSPYDVSTVIILVLAKRKYLVVGLEVCKDFMNEYADHGVRVVTGQGNQIRERLVRASVRLPQS